jgi:hypothetical protein
LDLLKTFDILAYPISTKRLHMTAKIIDGKQIANEIIFEVKETISYLSV